MSGDDPTNITSWTKLSQAQAVQSVNGQTGVIVLAAADVDAVPTTRTVNSKALSTNIVLSASDVSAVPTIRTVNSKALSADITLTAADVSALPDSTTIPSTASDVGAVANASG